MRVTLDTNVLIAAFISRGHCHELFEHLVRHHEVALSEHIFREFSRILVDKFGMPAEEVDNAVTLLKSRIILVQPKTLDAPVSRDPDDDWILATAAAAQAACIISGDNDLLVLESFRGMAIIRPAAFWQFE
jgi:uncharacterized protein